MDESARHDPASLSRDGASDPSRSASNPASDNGSHDPLASETATHWAAALPPAPYVVVDEASNERRLAPLSPRVAVLFVAVVITAWVLWLGRDAVRPFLVGMLLVYLLDMPVRWLTRYRVPRLLAVLGVYVVVAIAIVELLNLTLTPLIGEIGRLVTDLPDLMQQFDAQLQRLAEIYAGLNLPPGVRAWIDSAIEGIENGEGSFDPGIVLPVVTGAGGFLAALFGYIILPVWAFYLLKDRVQLTALFDQALPAAWRPDVWATIRIVERVFGQWVRGQIVLGVTVAIATFVALTLLSQLVDPIFGRYAVLLSVIAGVLELLPIIGPILAAIPAVLLAATAGLEATIAALVVYTAIQQLENYILVPKIQGDAVQLNPAAVIFALIVGASLAGLLGAILALPVVAAFRDVVRFLFRRAGPPGEGGSMAELGRDLGVELPPRPPTTVAEPEPG